MTKKILFLLPGVALKPCGGFKVIYEYANGLIKKGHYVTIVHPTRSRKDANFRNIFFGWILYFISVCHIRKWMPDNWFKIDKKVRLTLTPSLANHWISSDKYDVVVATSWETAEWMMGYDLPENSKIYFIQHFETWSGSEERVLKTWKLPLRKVVIARWLEKKAISLQEDCFYIPNGIDFEAFNVDVSIEKRDPYQVLMRYDDAYWKGSSYGIKALVGAKEKIPEMKVSLFGKQRRPAHLPEWMRYYSDPSQKDLRTLYNTASLFIAPSIAEGWALPPAESMACGCALVSTDIPGVSDYAIANSTALLSMPRDSEAMKNNIMILMGNLERRISLAKRGNEYIQAFTWNKSVNSFESFIFSEKDEKI